MVGRAEIRPTENTVPDRTTELAQQFVDDPPADVGQPLVAAVVEVGELLVVEAHQVQDRGVDVVDVGAVLDRVQADLVGRADDRAALDRRRRPSTS